MSFRRLSRAILVHLLPRTIDSHERNRNSIRSSKKEIMFDNKLKELNHPIAEDWFWIFLVISAILVGIVIGYGVSAGNPQMYID